MSYHQKRDDQTGSEGSDSLIDQLKGRRSAVSFVERDLLLEVFKQSKPR